MSRGERAAALRPPHHGKEAQPHAVKPRALFAGRELEVRVSPAPAPVILRAIEARAAGPVESREFERVADAEPSLLRRVHQEQSAQRPEGLPAERGFRLLLDDDHAAAGIGKLGGCREAREARSDHDGVGIR